ncbi:MAG: AraC family transcriptional regulator [Spirochaetaceae bacterium]
MPIYYMQKENYSSQFKNIHPFVRQCGNNRRGRWSIMNRKLLDYLLIYVKEGEGIFSLDSKSYKVRSGDLFCIPPDVVCSLRGVSESMVCPFVHFDLIYRDPESHWDFVIPENTTNLEKWIEHKHPILEPDSIFHKLTGHHRLGSSITIGSLIEDICHDSAKMLPYYPITQTGRLYQILGLILKDKMNEGTDLQSFGDRFTGLSQFIRLKIREKKSMDDVVTVSDCAKFCNLSESYLRKVFSNFYGMSPRDYIVNMRLQYAKELLHYPEFSITDVALACGYESIHSFSKIFKKINGLTPSSYRMGLL